MYELSESEILQASGGENLFKTALKLSGVLTIIDAAVHFGRGFTEGMKEGVEAGNFSDGFEGG